MLNDDLLKKYYGGLSINASVLNALARGITTILELGRSLGTALKRSISGSMCKI